MKRILLSVPHMSGREEFYVRETFRSNWMSSVGPNIVALEEEFQRRLGRPAVALSSGTAAIHLGLRYLGVGPGDEVFCPTLTFVATANPIRYLGARPVFLDSDEASWNLDPWLLRRVLREKERQGRLPRAVIVVHLYGQCADMDPITKECARYGIPTLEDAAEALGASYKNHPAGVLGTMGAFSFNGNKIITTTSGGMLMCPDQSAAEKLRYWSQQAKNPGLAYDHSEVGYNYRMSNLLAAVGLGQMEVLEDRVEQRRAIAFRYWEALREAPGICFMPQAPYGLHTNWLSCCLIDEAHFGHTRDEVITALDAAGVESRPVWKPMHLQPLYAAAEIHGGQTAERLFRTGICLPSSSSLTESEQLHVVNVIRRMAAMSDLRELAPSVGSKVTRAATST